MNCNRRLYDTEDIPALNTMMGDLRPSWRKKKQAITHIFLTFYKYISPDLIFKS